MAIFETMMKPILAREGGYADHPADRGGKTQWGITEAVARAAGYGGAMRDLSREQALEIYRARYWAEPGLDRVAALSPEVAAEMLDTGINMGPAVAAAFLQRALNALNRQARDYADVAVDGQTGERTLAALAGYLRQRGSEGERTLVRAMNGLQAERYIALTEQRPANEAFAYGWLARRIG